LGSLWVLYTVLFARLLAPSQKVLRPAISTQVFLVFLCLKANAEMVPKFPVATACFSCSPPDLDPSNSHLTSRHATKLFVYPNYLPENKISSMYHTNVFTFILHLPKRKSKAWEPSNKLMLLFPPNSVSRFHPVFCSSSQLPHYTKHETVLQF
jgi:hypothetical protein